jgi:gamma-butyrobetaine dioxygenase
VVDVPDIPLTVKPRKVNVFNQTVHITWPGQRASEFSFEWLGKHSYGINHQEVVPPGSDVVNMVQLDYEALKKTSKNLRREYARGVSDAINKHGCVVVRHRGTDVEEIIRDFLPPGEDVWESHFGRIEDLRTDNTTNKNTDQLGYTNAGVAPHTDMPFVHNPPSMQLLLSMQKADIGGWRTCCFFFFRFQRSTPKVTAISWTPRRPRCISSRSIRGRLTCCARFPSSFTASKRTTRPSRIIP